MDLRQHRHRAATSRRRKLGSRVLRGLGRVVQTLIALFTVAAAAVVVMAVVAQHQPLSAGPWLTKLAQNLIHEQLAENGLVGRVGGFDLTLQSGLVPVVTARDVALAKEGEGDPLIAVESAEVVFHRRPLVLGQLQPRAIRVTGLRAVLRAEGEGVSLGADRAVILDAVRNPGEALAQLRNILERPRFAGLWELGLRGIDFRYEDRVNGWSWHSRDGGLRINRSGQRISLDLALAGPGSRSEPGSITLITTARLKEGTGELRLAARGINPAQLLPEEIPSFTLPAEPRVDLPLSLDLTAQLRKDGTLAPLLGRLAVGDGTLRLGNQSVMQVENGEAALRVDLDRDRLSVEDLRFESDIVRLDGRASVFPEMREDGSIGAMVAQLSMGQVGLDLGTFLEEKLNLENFETALRLDMASRRLDIAPTVAETHGTRLQLDGWVQPPIEEQAVIEAPQSRKFLPDGWRMAMDVAAPTLGVDAARVLWPPSVESPTRTWVTKAIHDGQINDPLLAIRLGKTGKPDVALSFRFADGRMTADPALPEFTNASGFFSLQEHRLAVAVDRADAAAPNGGVVELRNGEISKSDIRVKETPLEVVAHGEAAAGTVMSLLTLPLFSKGDDPAKMPLAPDEISGKAIADLTLSLPMGRRRDPKALAYTVNAELTDVTTAELISGHVVDSPRLVVSADRAGVEIAGPARLDGFPISVRWARALGEGSGPSQLQFSAPLTQGLVAALGVPLGAREASGAGQVKGTVDLAPGEAPKIALTGDLTGLRMALPSLGWSKPAGRTGELVLAGRLGTAPVFDRLKLEAPGLLLDGEVRLSNGKLASLRLGRARIGTWFDGALTARPGADNRLSLDITRGRVDLKGLPKGGSNGDSGNGGKIGELKLALNEVRVSDRLALSAVSGNLDLSDGASGRVNGRVNGGGRVRVDLRDAAKGTRLRIRSDDAGALLRDAGFYKTARGGSADLRLTPTGETGSFVGDMKIEGMTITEAPVAANLISAISLVGLAEQMSEGGLYFGRIEADFLLTPKRVVVSKSSATGPSLGLSLDGALNLDEKTMDMQGVLSPFYFVNRVGAGMTRRGEGLVGITFRLDGPFEAPKLRANPLSVLTPGLFREIFRRPPPVLEDGS